MLLCLFCCMSKAQYKQLTNIPSVYIETFDHRIVSSKTEYKLCKIVRVDNGRIEVFDSVKIRGRGNASWGFPKKPYRLKFPKKVRLLGDGFANAKNWVLLSNGGEKLMLRNALNSYVGKLNGLPFNPSCKFVDLFMNNNYRGTYQITDHLDVRKHRVEIEEQDTVVTSIRTNISGGYFLEADGYTDPDGMYFQTPSGTNVRIHSPKKDVINTRQLNYIKNFMKRFETTLFGKNYLDKKRGYRQYIDSTTLLGWYLSSEIGSNFDLFHSTYFYKKLKDDHIYFGPLWDNDLGYNHDSRYGDETETLMANVAYGSSKWFQRIRTDPWFKHACANQFSHLYENGLDSLMFHYIDSVVNEIHPSVDENFKVWSIRAIVHSDMVVFDTYDEYVEDIKKFIVNHNKFLYRTFKRQDPCIFVPDTSLIYIFANKRYSNAVIGITDSISDDSQPCLRRIETGQLAQQWSIRPCGNGTYTICNVRTGQHLADLGDKKTSRITLSMVKPAKKDSTQLWLFVPQTAKCINLQNAYTKRILTNYNSFNNDGNNIYGYMTNRMDSVNDSRLWAPIPLARIPDYPDGIEHLKVPVDYKLVYGSNQQLHFVASEPSALIFRANVYDLNGLLRGSFRGDEAFDMSRLPGGTYIISWQAAGRSHSAKIYKSE